MEGAGLGAEYVRPPAEEKYKVQHRPIYVLSFNAAAVAIPTKHQETRCIAVAFVSAAAGFVSGLFCCGNFFSVQDAKPRHRNMRKVLAAHLAAENAKAKVCRFFEDSLGNLPLSVMLCAETLLSDPTMGVEDLLRDFEDIPLTKFDAHQKKTSSAYYWGLVKSVLISIKRLYTSRSLKEEDRDNALALLLVLAYLPERSTPIDLFLQSKDDVMASQSMDQSGSGANSNATGSGSSDPSPGSDEDAKTQSLSTGMSAEPESGDEKEARPFGEERKGCDGRATRQLPAFASLFVAHPDPTASHFAKAREVLISHGLLRSPDSSSGQRLVGNLHKLVQKCVRQVLGGGGPDKGDAGELEDFVSKWWPSSERGRLTQAKTTLQGVLRWCMEEGSPAARRRLVGCAETWVQINKHDTSQPNLRLRESVGQHYLDHNSFALAEQAWRFAEQGATPVRFFFFWRRICSRL